MIHQVALEQYAFPGALIIGTDSHTPMAGGLGALAVGVGGADASRSWQAYPGRLLYPRVIGVHRGVSSRVGRHEKTSASTWSGRLGVTGATNAIIEYFGPGTASTSATGKATITNMGAELRATTWVFPFDEWMATYLGATGRDVLTGLAQRNRHLLVADAAVEYAPDRYFDLLIEIDLSTLEPHLVGPPSPGRARPRSHLADEVHAEPDQLVTAIST